MARRIKRFKEKRRAKSLTTNRHHLLFQGRHWKRGLAKKIRSDPVFIVCIDIDVHDRIHREVMDIPVPSDKSLKVACERLQNERYWLECLEPMGKIQWLMDCFRDDHKTNSALRACRDIIYEEIFFAEKQDGRAIAAYAF